MPPSGRSTSARVSRALGLSSFPTLWIRRGEDIEALPLTYDPGQLSARIAGLTL
ncbi:MAG: hypothetical protein ACK4GT_10325 [Pararhodobacter sp.]